MRPTSPRFFTFIALSLLLSSVPSAIASDNRDDRDVRLTYVQGDVRLSRGDGKHPDLNESWEVAQPGDTLEQGFALFTGRGGRAEISFEDGSSVFLSENSLLLFNDLSTPKDRTVTRMTLATGTATFSLQPVDRDDYFLATPASHFLLFHPETFYARVDAYLDATGITAQGPKSETMSRYGRPVFQMHKGQTFFFQNGRLIGSYAAPEPDPLADTAKVVLSATRSLLLPGAQFLQSLVDSCGTAIPGCVLPTSQSRLPATTPSQTAWDSWVSDRVQQENAVVTAALKASGLSSPIPGLADMYEHGSFFPCDYGTCWEPTEPRPETDLAHQAPPPTTQSPAPGKPTEAGQDRADTVFQPQTITWYELLDASCGRFRWRKVTRVAHSPKELEEILREKELAERAFHSGLSFLAGCRGYWFYQHGHYVRVVTTHHPPKCFNGGCKPVHTPRPIWVRNGKQVGFVPRHPNDVPGKPPINLKNGIFVPPTKPGQAPPLVAVNSQKVSVLNNAPKEFQNALSSHAPAVTAPTIHAHLLLENRSNSLYTAHRAPPTITYDYKSHNFVMPSAPGSHSSHSVSKPVAVGGINKNGAVASFADGRSSHYASNFGHSSAAASYGGGSHAFSRGGYSGGGHSSGGSSGGSSGRSGGGGGFSGGGGSSGAGGSSGGGSAGSAGSHH